MATATCPSCRLGVPEWAWRCPYCRRKLRSEFWRRQEGDARRRGRARGFRGGDWRVLGGVAAGLAMIYLLQSGPPAPRHRPHASAPSPPPFVILPTAYAHLACEDLSYQYAVAGRIAEGRNLNRRLVLTGTVLRVTLRAPGEASLILKGYRDEHGTPGLGPDIDCEFDALADLVGVIPGTTVTVKGVCREMTTTVRLDRCELLPGGR